MTFIQLRTWLKTHNLLSLCLLLFLLSFSLHLTQGLRHINFTQDQARDAYLMRSFQAAGDVFIPYGPKASVGNFYLPPLYYQLDYWLSVAFGQAPLIMQWVTVLVESFTPVLVFLLLRMIFKPQSALFGALVYSLSTFVIISSASAWNPNMIPFFTTLALFCWFQHLLKGSRWTIIVGCLSVTAAFHFHYQAVVVVPFVAIIFLLSLKKNLRYIWYWVLGGIASLATFMPYILAELHSNWQNTRAVIAFFTYQRTQYFDRISKPAFVLTFLPGFVERVLIKNDLTFIIIGRLLFIGGLLTLAYQTLKSRRKFLLLSYFILIFIMLRIYKGDKLDYYMSTLYLLPAVLYAAISEYIQRWAIVPILVLAVVTGWLMATSPYENGLQSLDQETAFIASQTPNSSGRVLFHNLEDINLFAYGFKYLHPFTVDPNANTIVDICYSGVNCTWNGVQACYADQSPADVKAIYVKTQFGYTGIASSPAKFEHVITVGTVNDSQGQPRYKYYNLNTDYGSDVLLPQLQSY